MGEYDPFAEDFGAGGIPGAASSGPPGKRFKSAAWDQFPEGSVGVEQPGVPSRTPPPEPGRAHLRPHTGGKSVEELIGNVRAVRNPNKERLCAHFLKEDCMWGDNCRFSHSVEALRAGAPATENLDFRNLDASLNEKTIDVPKRQLSFLMTNATKQLLIDATGVSEIVWHRDRSSVTIVGAAQQVESAERLLKRVTTHCNWGINQSKVEGLLRLQPCKTARLRLSPMSPLLKEKTFSLTELKTKCTLGSGASNDITLSGPLISRSHAVLDFSPGKGALYVIDTSTNGTFLNGVALPAKSSGKVVLWHGDELAFPEPNKAPNETEFGYMVNLELLT